jgi:predicted SAM-dependent methyltransferase
MKLHIGGKEVKEGWKIFNIQQLPGVDYQGDITDLGQFADNSCEEVYASHVLEHVAQDRVVDTLKGIYRILKPGGKFYVSVPDLDILCHAFISPVAPPDIKFHIMRMIFGAQTDKHDFHFFGWNQLFLFHFLKLAEFSTFKRVDSFGIFQDFSEYRPYGFPISLNVISSK